MDFSRPIGVRSAPDNILSTRVLLTHGSVLYRPLRLVSYRTHGGNDFNVSNETLSKQEKQRMIDAKFLPAMGIAILDACIMARDGKLTRQEADFAISQQYHILRHNLHLHALEEGIDIRSKWRWFVSWCETRPRRYYVGIAFLLPAPATRFLRRCIRWIRKKA